MIQHHFEEEIRRLESLIDAMMLINPNQLAHIKKKQIDFKFKERTMIDLLSKPTVENNNNNNNNNNNLKSPKYNSHDRVESSNHNNSDDNNNDDNDIDIDNNSISSRPKSDDSHGGNRLSYDGIKVERSQSMDERGNVPFDGSHALMVIEMMIMMMIMMIIMIMIIVMMMMTMIMMMMMMMIEMKIMMMIVMLIDDMLTVLCI